MKKQIKLFREHIFPNHISLKRLLGRMLLGYLAVVVVCVTLPPLVQKEAVQAEAKAENGAAAGSEGTEGQYDDPAPEEKAEGQYGASSPEERVLAIDDNTEALRWRLALIEGAREEIIFSTFDLGTDQGGMDIMAALYGAAKRGVQVKIMTDGVNAMLKLKGSEAFRELVSLPEVEAKQYNPIHLLMPWKWNYRMHDKYLIIDGQAYILGGRNSNNLFLGQYQDSYNIDRDVLVYQPKGDETAASQKVVTLQDVVTLQEDGSLQDAVQQASVDQLKSYFDGIWQQKECRVLSGRHQEAASQELLAHYGQLREKYPEVFESDRMAAILEETSFPAQKITLLSNPTQAANKQPQLLAALNRYMEEGEAILIQTPYIVCNGQMYEELSRLGEERTIQIMTNAVEEGANPWGCTDYLNQKSRILATGAEVYEVLCGQSLHIKTVLIDEDISIVGSFNYDMRSAYLDTELMLVIECPQLNEQLRDAAELLAQQSKHVTADGREEDGAAYVPVRQSLWQKTVYGLLRVLIRPFRHLM